MTEMKAPGSIKPLGPRRRDRVTGDQLEALVAEDKMRRLYNLGRQVDMGEGKFTYKDPKRSKYSTLTAWWMPS